MLITFSTILIFFLRFEGGHGFDGGFRDVALRVHNDLRKRLDLSPLQLDSGVRILINTFILNIVAQRHATTLAVSEKFQSSGGGYGKKENLWAFYGDLRTLADDVSQATHDWFDGSSASNNLLSTKPNTVLSKETSLLGVGAETNQRGYSVVVANYL